MPDTKPPKQTITFDSRDEFIDWKIANMTRLVILTETLDRSLFRTTYKVTYRELAPGEQWATAGNPMGKIMLIVALVSIVAMALIIALNIGAK